MPRPSGGLIVTQVAPRSVAARAGVSAKDFLAEMDGEPAA
jgi:S1-C subfamily serine protease